MTRFIVDGESYELVRDHFTFGEAKLLERVTGHTYQEIRTKKEVAESISVSQAVFWLSMKRVKPELAFSDLDDIDFDGIEFEPEEGEIPAGPPEEPEAEASPPAGEPTEAEPTLGLSATDI